MIRSTKLNQVINRLGSVSSKPGHAVNEIPLLLHTSDAVAQIALNEHCDAGLTALIFACAPCQHLAHALTRDKLHSARHMQEGRTVQVRADAARS